MKNLSLVNSRSGEHDSNMTAELTDLKKCAFLAAQGYAQKEIADALSVSQATVSRMIQEARNLGVLVTECRISEQEKTAMSAQLLPVQFELRNRLLQLGGLASVLQDVVILAEPPHHYGVSPTARLRWFGVASSGYLAKKLTRMNNVGVAWGKTLARVADALKLNVIADEAASVRFFPLCGEPLDYPVTEYGASSLAARFQEAVTGKISEFSLGPVPARIPRRFGSKEQSVIRDFFRRSKRYAQIFEGPEALVEVMDTVLTSGGTFDSRSYDDLWLKDTTEAEELDVEKLMAMTLGDIAGAFIPVDGITTDLSLRLREVSERWTGVTLDQLSRCAARAKQKEQLGVVLFASGVAKARMAYAAVQSGLVSTLVIDRELALSVVQRLQGRQAKPTQDH